MNWWIVWYNPHGWENNVARQQKLTARQKQGNASRRKRALRKWFAVTARRLTLGGAVAGVLLASVGGWWFWHSGRLENTLASAAESLWKKTASVGFRVSDVYLEGRNFTALDDVHKALGVKRGDPILSLPLEKMRERLEAIPRVRYAEVARVLPDRLHVKLIERSPAAVWQHNGKLKLIDSEGTAMEYADLRKYPKLIVLVGEDAPGHASALLGLLASQPELYSKVAAAVRVGERRWNLRFRNGMELRLPESKPENAWKQFAELDAKHHILDRPVMYVDMRLEDRVFIKSQPDDSAGAEKKPSDKKSET